MVTLPVVYLTSLHDANDDDMMPWLFTDSLTF